jgi:hypothetical protein
VNVSDELLPVCISEVRRALVRISAQLINAIAGGHLAECPGFAMRRQRMIWLNLTLALLAWPVWQAWWWELERRVYASQMMTPLRL